MSYSSLPWLSTFSLFSTTLPLPGPPHCSGQGPPHCCFPSSPRSCSSPAFINAFFLESRGCVSFLSVMFSGFTQVDLCWNPYRLPVIHPFTDVNDAEHTDDYAPVCWYCSSNLSCSCRQTIQEETRLSKEPVINCVCRSQLILPAHSRLASHRQ